MTVEANFDGLVGPSHHYGGLGVGNVASLESQNKTSYPKAGALQGLEKMRAVAELGVPQFFLPPCRRPNIDWLRELGFKGSDADVLKAVADTDASLLSAAYSSAFMWTANAATITPSADSGDGCLHLSVANLCSNLHRQQEADERFEQLNQFFKNVPKAIVHPPLPNSFPLRDEGAANHMRLAVDTVDAAGPSGAGQGVHIFVDGEAAVSGFRGRQGRQCSAAIARRHALNGNQIFMLHQHPDAIAAGVFHNDVIATSHQFLLIQHERAFLNADDEMDRLEKTFQRSFGRSLLRIVVTEDQLSLKEAVATYLFNSQMVTNSSGTFTIICPENCQRSSHARKLVEGWIADEGNPITEVQYLPLDQSMANGGGPACLRLRVQLTPEQINSLPTKYSINDDSAQRIAAWIQKWYPESLSIGDLVDVKFAQHCWAAVDRLLV